MEMENLMSSIKVEGMEDYLRLLDLTNAKLRSICGRSIYPGAKIIAQDCKRRIQNLHVDTSYFGKWSYRLGITNKQKEGLSDSMGIARIRRKGGSFDVKLGFDGYNKIKTKTYPKGQPNAMIARSVNKGTSFMKAQPFMDQSIEACRKPVEDKIEEQFYKELERLWGKWFDKH